MAYLDDTIRAVRRWDQARERSQQTAVGISELSGCRAHMGFRLRGAEPTDHTDMWRATAGTALHGWMAGVREQAARESGELAAFELPVNFMGVPGHVDEVNYTRGKIIDWKFLTKASAAAWADPAVLAERFVQLHAYGAAIIGTDQWKGTAPDPDSMDVELLIAPVDGSFGDWHTYEEPLDVEVAEEAVRRFRDVQGQVAAGFGGEQDKPFFWCRKFCEFFTACRGGGYGPVIRYDEITDEELAAAIEAYGLAGEQAAEARRIRDSLAPMLDGIRGQARGWTVRMSKPGQDKWVPDLDEIYAQYQQRGETVPLIKKEGRRSYVIAERA